MKYITTLVFTFALIALLSTLQAAEKSYAELPQSQQFIKTFAAESAYSEAELRQIFSQVYPNQSVLDKISRPAEKTTPWYKYKTIFADEARLTGGIQFFKANQATLMEAYEKYGVSPYIIVAIIGVETRYGKIMGSDQVITAISTIAFDYPKRAPYFLGELRAFLTIVKDENLDPYQPLGSYAGAMGMTQFMPSSYQNYAVDYEGDGKRDLWTNPKDAIFSVANYLAARGWQRDALIVDNALTSDGFSADSQHKPFTQLSEFKSQGVFLASQVALDNSEVGLLKLDGEEGPLYFITFPNFAVITTYNTSPMYAMAVNNLAEAIATAVNTDTTE